jgi:hypothetical protein
VQKKKSRFRCDWRPLATVTSKTGMRSLSTDCDSEQEPQPRKLSCRISIRLEEVVTRHCLLNASEGMIFRDSRFCKEELAQKPIHDGVDEEKKVMRRELPARLGFSFHAFIRSEEGEAWALLQLTCICSILRNETGSFPSNT